MDFLAQQRIKIGIVYVQPDWPYEGSRVYRPIDMIDVNFNVAAVEIIGTKYWTVLIEPEEEQTIQPAQQQQTMTVSKFTPLQ